MARVCKKHNSKWHYQVSNVIDSFKPFSSTQNAMNIIYLSLFVVTYKRDKPSLIMHLELGLLDCVVIMLMLMLEFGSIK
jgi:hypothetical protein